MLIKTDLVKWAKAAEAARVKPETPPLSDSFTIRRSGVGRQPPAAGAPLAGFPTGSHHALQRQISFALALHADTHQSALTCSLVPVVFFSLVPNRAHHDFVCDDLEENDVTRSTKWNDQFARATIAQLRLAA